MTATEAVDPRPTPFEIFDHDAAPPESHLKPRPFPLWGPEDFAAHETPRDLDILGEAIVRKGNMALLMGQPGLGKSTMAFALAISDLRGDSHFCGIPFHRNVGTHRRWLFVGTENGLERWKRDLADAAKTIPEDRRTDFNHGLRVAALFADEDADILLPNCEGRLRETVRNANPAVVVLDPWAELCESEVDSVAVRATLVSLRRAIRQAAPEAAILLVIHARAGREVVAEALGNFGAVNAQRGNRLVFSSARSVLLLVPHDEHGHDLVLGLVKHNDGPQLAPRRLAFDREAFVYRVLENFDFATWRDGLREKKTPRRVTPQQVAEVVAKGAHETRDIVRRFSGVASERAVKGALSYATDHGLLKRTAKGRYDIGPNLHP